MVVHPVRLRPSVAVLLLFGLCSGLGAQSFIGPGADPVAHFLLRLFRFLDLVDLLLCDLVLALDVLDRLERVLTHLLDAQEPLADGAASVPSPTYVSDFLATSDGLALTKAFMRIKEPRVRRRIVDLVEEIAEHDE